MPCRKRVQTLPVILFCGTGTAWFRISADEGIERFVPQAEAEAAAFAQQAREDFHLSKHLLGMVDTVVVPGERVLLTSGCGERNRRSGPSDPPNTNAREGRTVRDRGRLSSAGPGEIWIGLPRGFHLLLAVPIPSTGVSDSLVVLIVREWREFSRWIRSTGGAYGFFFRGYMLLPNGWDLIGFRF